MIKCEVLNPISAGIFLSYKCTSKCKHCMYASSPTWEDDWISVKDLEVVLTQLSDTVTSSPNGSNKVSLNSGLHFTGGEPFLNFDLLRKAISIADELEIPSIFVETNCYWCINDNIVQEKLRILQDSGLDGILVSVNPFILEQIPYERTERAVRISEEVFNENLMIYQKYFYHQFKRLCLKNTLSLNNFLKKSDSCLDHIELIPKGRVPYKLSNLFHKYPPRTFFRTSCYRELTRNWHVHVDNYCNYIAGYCGGISLGDVRDLKNGINLKDRPILNHLFSSIGDLYKMCVEEFGYIERKEGYISKCHLCVDMRKHIVSLSTEYKELKPIEFYHHLDD